MHIPFFLLKLILVGFLAFGTKLIFVEKDC